MTQLEESNFRDSKSSFHKTQSKYSSSGNFFGGHFLISINVALFGHLDISPPSETCSQEASTAVVHSIKARRVFPAGLVIDSSFISVYVGHKSTKLTEN